jgi:hypothetical protein
MSSKWLHWTDKSTESSHHSEASFVGFVGSPQGSSEIIRTENHEMIFNTPYQEPSKPTKPDVEPEITGIPASSTCPPMPIGVKLVRYEPRKPPVAVDVCTVVTDVPKFIERELRDLDSRLNSPWAIRGGWSVPEILDRLRQVGVGVEIDLKGDRSF